MTTHSITCSLVRKQKQVVFDYTKNNCSIIFTVSTVDNKLRAKQICTAVFKLTRNNNWYPQNIEVIGGYKRKGIATIMYDIVQSEIVGTLLPSDEQSDEAKAFWQNRLLTINNIAV